LTEKLHLFYNEENFLCRDLIRIKLEENLKDEEYKNYLNKIEAEKSKLDILKDYCWPEKSINESKQILEEKSKEIYSKIEQELIQQEIENLEVVSISGNDLDWGNPIKKYKLSENSKNKTVKLYKNMLFYSACNELINKIMNSKDNKERNGYGKEILKLGLGSILKFINSFGNEAFGDENRKRVKSMIRAQLIIKIWNDEIDLISVKYFIKDLKDKVSRYSISEEVYGFTYQIASKYSLIMKIMQQNLNQKI